MIIDALKQLVETARDGSENNAVLARYVLEYPDEVVRFTIDEFAQMTFTSRSAVTRFSKRLGYESFPKLKVDIAQHLEDFFAVNQKVEANLPIKKGWSDRKIGKVISDLYHQTIDEAYAHLNYNDLRRAARLILDADHVTIFGKGNSLLVAEDFYLKIRKIGVVATCDSPRGFQRVLTRKHRIEETAVFISHYLTTQQTLKMIRQLKERHVHIVLVTANVQALISKEVDVVLPVEDDETYIKMGNISSTLAEEFVLDVLYSIMFEMDYDANVKLVRRINGGFQEPEFR